MPAEEFLGEFLEALVFKEIMFSMLLWPQVLLEWVRAPFICVLFILQTSVVRFPFGKVTEGKCCAWPCTASSFFPNECSKKEVFCAALARFLYVWWVHLFVLDKLRPCFCLPTKLEHMSGTWYRCVMVGRPKWDEISGKPAVAESQFNYKIFSFM